MQARPFKIDISQDILDDLFIRLEATRWPDDIPGANWDYGTNLAFMKELVQYWIDKYDWRKSEAEMNRCANFKAEIDGTNIHFIHERGQGPNPMPLILTHGWPDSFWRYNKVIPMLTDPKRFGGDPEDSFDVVVPSLPGFGFSGQKSLNADQVASLWGKLMEGLGYKHFVAAAGDLGTDVTKSLAVQSPTALTAMHLTDVGYPTGKEDVKTMSQAEQKYLAFVQQWMFTEGGYVMVQSTKPQSLAFGFCDSPVALAAWIVEKFRTFSDCHGDVETRFTKDELVTNIMIYWLTNTGGSSERMYFENFRAKNAPGGMKADQKSTVPAAYAVFPGGSSPQPREWAERRVNLKRYTVMPKGGHFAAMEEPELLVKDMREFFNGFRNQAQQERHRTESHAKAGAEEHPTTNPKRTTVKPTKSKTR
jgi:pimeloyl-ACP methyl ester carboxylesterase